MAGGGECVGVEGDEGVFGAALFERGVEGEEAGEVGRVGDEGGPDFGAGDDAGRVGVRVRGHDDGVWWVVGMWVVWVTLVVEKEVRITFFTVVERRGVECGLDFPAGRFGHQYHHRVEHRPA